MNYENAEILMLFWLLSQAPKLDILGRIALPMYIPLCFHILCLPLQCTLSFQVPCQWRFKPITIAYKVTFDIRWWPGVTNKKLPKFLQKYQYQERKNTKYITEMAEILFNLTELFNFTLWMIILFDFINFHKFPYFFDIL